MFKTCLRANRTCVQTCGHVRERSLWNTERSVLSSGNCGQQKLSPVTCRQGLPEKLWQGLNGLTWITICQWKCCLCIMYLKSSIVLRVGPWWRHQMETFPALLALYVGNSPVTGEFPSQRPVTRSFDVVFDLHLNKRLSKQSRRRWFETSSCSPWRHCNVILQIGERSGDIVSVLWLGVI